MIARQRPEALDAIEAEAERVGAPLSEAGRDFDAFMQGGRMVFQDGERPARPAAAEPVRRAPGGQRRPGRSRRCWRWAIRASTRAAIAAGVAGAVWPARMQRLTRGAVRRGGRGARLRPLARRRPQPARGRGDGGGAGGHVGARRPAVSLVVGMLANKGRRRLVRGLPRAEAAHLHRPGRGGRRRLGRGSGRWRPAPPGWRPQPAATSWTASATPSPRTAPPRTCASAARSTCAARCWRPRRRPGRGRLPSPWRGEGPGMGVETVPERAGEAAQPREGTDAATPIGRHPLPAPPPSRGRD